MDKTVPMFNNAYCGFCTSIMTSSPNSKFLASDTLLFPIMKVKVGLLLCML